MAKERLDKLLTTAGMGSRKQAIAIIRAGRVLIDGQVCKDASAKFDVTLHQIEVNGMRILERKPRYYMLHKPAGYLSATTDNFQSTVVDLFPPDERDGLLLVGRLDKYTEGLLLLTDDGAFVHALTAPRRHVDKIYFAQVEGTLHPDAAAQFAAGVHLADGSICRPATLRVLAQTDVGCTVEVVLHEGKYHQVKRMIAAMGGHVAYLKRLSIGKLQLGDLAKGDWRPLTRQEVTELLQNANKTDSTV